jgi:hypothetical protein
MTGTLLFFCFSFPWLDDERIRNQFPEIFHFHIHEVVFFAQALHNLVAAVVTRRDEKLRSGVLDLFRLDPTIKDSFLGIGRSPRSATRSTTKVVGAVRVHFDIILTALLSHPARLFIIAVSESPFALPAVVAGIVIGGQLLVNGLVDLYASLFDVLFQKIVNADELDVLMGIPFLQTKPGRIICVPSFG